MLEELVVWGVLPIAVPVLAWCAERLAGLLYSRDELSERAAAAVVIAMALVHASVGTLGELGALSRTTLLAVLALVAAVLSMTTARASGEALLRAAWVRSPLATTLVSLTLISVTVTARLLPVWQWDSWGYHLPFVNFALQHRGFAAVPPDLNYISTYPHNIELGMIWLRAMLPDDRLIDLAQVPYGLAGAVLTAAIARRLGAARGPAMLAGAAWLTLPAVFLQLPTNYVDVGTAATLLGAVFFLIISPVTPAGLLLGGIALGLFLGSKPSAPLAAAFIALVAFVRGMRRGQARALSGGALATLVFGCQMYVVMWLRHGNPVWPVAVTVAGIKLPGTHSVEQLLAAGSGLPHASGGLIERLSVSWLAIDTPPVFDMKLGGLGVVFLAALPLAVFGLVRRRAPAVLLAMIATLLSPDPSIPRYILGFPALVLGLAAAQFPERRRHLAAALVVALSAFQVSRAWPGLVGDGPPWPTFWSLSDEERRLALGPHGPPTDYPPAWARVARGESVAFDPDFEFPGLLWAPDLRYPVYAVPLGRGSAELSDWLDAQHVRLFAAGDRTRALVEGQPDRWQRLFECRSANCTVYVRR